jgi:protein SCO1/2
VLGDLFAALQKLPQRAGRDYRLVVVGIDPSETPADAAGAKARHLADMPLPGAGSGIMFLTGESGPVAAIAAAAGFPYRAVPEVGQIAHPAGLVVATPHGVISRYVLGLGYRPRDLRLAIDEAGAGTVAAPAERLLLLCFGYDPARGQYDLAVGRLMTATGAVTLVAVGGVILASARRRRRR